MPKFLLYLPYSEFFDYYTYKALGEIPLAFKNIGYESELIVGQMKSELYKKLNVKIFETGYLDTEFIVDQRQKHKLKYRIKNLLDFRELKKVLRILKQEKPDLIMSYNNSTLTPLIFIIYRISILFHGYKPRIVLKLDNDGSDLSGLKGLKKILLDIYYYIISLTFDRVIAETSCGSEIFQKFPGMKKIIRTVPNSIDNDFIQNNDEKKEKKIITVSMISRKKGIDTVIEAFNIISKKYEGWKLDIIGMIEDKNYFNELKNFVNYNGLSSNVSFKGEYNKTQLIDAYKKASIFCLMSYNESFALSRLEAISFDDYVISSNAGCAKDFLKYGIKIVEAGNVNGLVNAISNYIENGKNFNSRTRPKIPTYEDIARKISDPEF